MAAHEELITEMPLLEKKTIQERLKHAKKRRSQQLKTYQQYERELIRRTKKLNSQRSDSSQGPLSPGVERNYLIEFAPNVQLLEAAARGDTEEVEAFLKAGVDPNTGNEDGLTALHQSCIDNREDMLKVLIDNGANVNIKDREMWTPLHAASTCGHKNLAAQLITRGADLLAINSDGNMPYDICEDEETLDYIESQMAAQGITQDQIDDLREVAPNQMLDDMKSISANGGDLECKDGVGATPLHIAVAQGFEKVVEYLLECKVDIHARDEDGWQAIHAAACWAQAEIIQILVEHGADLDSRTTNNETPWTICEEDDIKSLIHQLKTENLKKDRNNLVRRSSSRKQQRSSIRRSSKRDKGDMRKLDAKGEAAFIQQSQETPATNPDDVVLNGPTTEDGEEPGEESSDQLPSPTDEPAAPDHIMTDEPLPECRLPQIETDQDGEITTDEHSPVTTPEPDASAEVNGLSTNNLTVGVEVKRPKSILKKTSSRVEVETDPGGKKPKKEDRKSERRGSGGGDQSLGLEQKQREKEEREKEKQRLKSEKEKKKQLEKEEKQRRREEAALKKQREKDDKLNRDQSVAVPKAEEINGGKTVGDDETARQTEDNGTEANGDSHELNTESLAALKRQRQQLNSPIHSNSGSPNLSAGSERSTDSQASGENLPPVSGEPNNKPAPIPLADKQGKQGGRFSSRFPFSLGFMQSYNLQNSSNYKMQKRDLVALTDPEDAQDVSPAGTDNGTSVTVHDEDGEPLKKFTAFSDSPGYENSDETEACCKLM